MTLNVSGAKRWWSIKNYIYNRHKMLRRGVFLQQTQKKYPTQKEKKCCKEKKTVKMWLSDLWPKTTLEKSLSSCKLHYKGARIEKKNSKPFFEQIAKGLIWRNTNNMEDASFSRNCDMQTLHPGGCHPYPCCWGVSSQLSRRIAQVCKRDNMKQQKKRILLCLCTTKFLLERQKV